MDRLLDRERTFRNAILRVDGDHAAVWLSLEAGLHRFVGMSSAPDPAHLHVSLIAQRKTLTDTEWTPPALDPPNAQAAEGLSRGPALREHVAGSDKISLLGGRAAVTLPLADYWPRFEEIALEHLLVFEADEAIDRDEQLRPLLDDTFAEVRDLARRNQKISAIKRYRELTGAGLREAKDVVEAMT